MQDLIRKGLGILWGAWRFRWPGLLVAWLVALTGWTLVELMEYRYTAQARIFVDTNRVLEPLLEDIAVQPDVTARVALLSRALLSRPNVERLIDLSGLDDELEKELVDEREYARAYESLVSELPDRIGMRSGRRNQSIYTITFTHADPQMAKRVVESVVEIFIESNLGEGRDDNEQAQRFLDARIAEYERRLADAEARLTQFRRENTGATPGEAGGYYQRFDAARTRLRSARLELREATNRRDELARQLSREQPVIYETLESQRSARELRIGQLQSELDELLLRFTDRHPRITELRDTIARLEADLLERPADESRPRRAQDNVVYQTLRPMVADAEAVVATLRARVEDYETQVAELEATVDSIPLVEARLQQLDRDYETVRGQHATLLERRESARLSEELEKKSDDDKFRLIDPPFVPTQPSSPAKSMRSALVFGASLAAGVGLAFLLSLLFPVFFDQQSLAEASGVPVLGSVARHPTRAERVRHWTGLALFWLLFFALPALLAVLLLLRLQGIELADVYAHEAFEPVRNYFDAERMARIRGSDWYSRLEQLVEFVR